MLCFHTIVQYHAKCQYSTVLIFSFSMCLILFYEMLSVRVSFLNSPRLICKLSTVVDERVDTYIHIDIATLCYSAILVFNQIRFTCGNYPGLGISFHHPGEIFEFIAHPCARGVTDHTLFVSSVKLYTIILFLTCTI